MSRPLHTPSGPGKGLPLQWQLTLPLSHLSESGMVRVYLTPCDGPGDAKVNVHYEQSAAALAENALELTGEEQGALHDIARADWRRSD